MASGPACAGKRRSSGRTTNNFSRLDSKMSDAPKTLILSEQGNGLLVVTLNRPDSRNALNTQRGRELIDLFLPLTFEPGQQRCIVITGSGDKAFCAGGDLKERQ